jgi:hypothetical protein
MANFKSLYPRLQSEAVGAPPALLDIKIRDAARQFMNEVPAWRVDHSDIAIVAGDRDYTLTVPAESQIVRCLEATFLATGQTTGTPLYPVPETMLQRNYKQVEGRPKYFMTPKLSILTLVPKPDANVSGTVTEINLQIRPSRITVSIDDDVLDRFEEEILVGAMWLLYDMQDQPWTNKAEARRYKLRFVKSWADARRELDKGYTRSSLRVKIPQI